ncbi:RHS repeat-associated core domain-containing protein [Pseudomonas monteilii]|uniref:RHS repeat-associated core domain-containing protein n=1 Tax=Pseudomonas monteilii TaxID=76759 RepID=UPI003827A3BB
MSMLKRFARVLCTTLLCMAMVNNAMAAVVTYYHNDISGSPIAATDAAGNLKWKESYKPYGDKLTRSAASSDNKIGFHGKAHDDSTGLSYMGARYYDPVLGRFTGVDPVDFQTDNLHSFNRYTYTNNNPYKFTDKNGKYAELVIEGASIALGTYSFQKNIDAGNYGNAVVDAAGVAFDAAMSIIPFAPGVAGIGINAIRGGEKAADIASPAIKTPTLEKQAANLIPLNNNKNSITLRSESVEIRVDLAGASHAGVPTPHVVSAPRNFKAPPHMERQYNTRAASRNTQPATQQDIRMVRHYLERQNR